MRVQTVNSASLAIRRRSAFTLMEVMVVVAILVVLAGVSGVFIFGAFSDAKTKAAQTSAFAIGDACDLYKVRTGNYPGSLSELLSPPDGGQPLLTNDTDLRDPWEHEFQFDPSGPRHKGRKVDVWTTNPETQQTVGNWR